MPHSKVNMELLFSKVLIPAIPNDKMLKKWTWIYPLEKVEFNRELH